MVRNLVSPYMLLLVTLGTIRNFGGSQYPCLGRMAGHRKSELDYLLLYLFASSDSFFSTTQAYCLVTAHTSHHPCKFHSLQIHIGCEFWGLSLHFPFLAISTPFHCKLHSLQIQRPLDRCSTSARQARFIVYRGYVIMMSLLYTILSYSSRIFKCDSSLKCSRCSKSVTKSSVDRITYRSKKSF